jgi:hypothetical protein
MDAYVTNAFQQGDLTADSPLELLNGIGPYLMTRIKTTLGFHAPQNVTIRDFVQKFRNKSAAQVARLLQLMLQNQRANQCVLHNSNQPRPDYHVRDVNQRGFDVCVALLRYAKRTDGLKQGLRFGQLTNAALRTNDAKQCGCKTRNQCVGPCKWANGACIPSSPNARGFEGVDTEPGQRVPFSNAQQQQRLLNAASVRRNRSLYNDPDSRADYQAQHELQMRYSQDGNLLWRNPHSRVRRPRI